MKRLVLPCVALLVLVAFGQPQSQYARASYFQPVEIPEWEISVRGIERRSDPLPATSGGEVVRPNGQFVVILLDLTNRSGLDRVPDAIDFRLVGKGVGQVWNHSESATARALAVSRGYSPFGSTVSAGASVETLLLFDLAEPFTAIELSIPAARTVVDLVECHCNLPSPVRTMTPWQATD